MGHAQGVEDALLGELGQRLGRHLLHHHRQQGVAAVAIEEPIAGREVQLGLLKQQAGDIAVSDHVVGPPSGEVQQVPLVTHAARVMQQLADRHHLAKVMQLRKVFADVVVQRQFSILDDEADREGGKLFGRPRLGNTVAGELGTPYSRLAAP